MGPPTDSECVTFTILDDMELEGDHGFEVTITNPGAFAALGTLSLTEVTIGDDERELLSPSMILCHLNHTSFGVWHFCWFNE